jgi:hypothetical protein
LGRHRTDRDARGHEPIREPGDGVAPALDNLDEAGLVEVCDTVVEGGEDGAVVQIGGIDGMSRRAQRVGERAAADC